MQQPISEYKSFVINKCYVAHEREIKSREDIQLLDMNFIEIYRQNISYIFHNVPINTEAICNMSQNFTSSMVPAL